MQPAYELADVLNGHWQQVETHPHINTWQLRTLGAIKRCRTAALGGHTDACANCGTVRNSYNSCRNRHCPKCQGREREAWIQKREEDLSRITGSSYSGLFHVVFTLPDTLNQIVCALSARKTTKDFVQHRLHAWHFVPHEVLAVTCCSAVCSKMCRLKSAHTLFKAIYIRSDVRPHRALAKKIIKKPKGGGKNNLNFFLGGRKKYSLKKIAFSVGLCVF